MPPIHPPGVPNIFSLPTITLMISITLIMQAVAIAFNSRTVKEYRGLWAAFLAVISLAMGFAILLGGRLGALRGLISNGMILTGHALIYVAICQFTGRPFSKTLTHVLLPLGYLGLLIGALLPRGMLPLITVTQLAGFPLNFASAYALYRAEKERYILGAYLTGLSVTIYGLITVWRFITGLISPQAVLPGPTDSNIFDVMSFYVLSYVWSAGFILMVSQRLQNDLHDLAMNDSLTRIRNRRAMQNLLDFEMHRVETDVRDFSVILLDVDHFKNINDSYGHDIGDIVLRWMAQTLQSALRLQDIVARWGGEEFLVLLPDTNLQEGLEIAERLRTLISESWVIGTPYKLQISFSAGVANSKSSRNVSELCKVADQALYIAKEKRNHVVSQSEIRLLESAGMTGLS